MIFGELGGQYSGSSTAPPSITSVVIVPSSGPMGSEFVAQVTAGGGTPNVELYAWSLNGVVDRNSNGDTYVPGEPGTLTVTVKLGNAAGSVTATSPPATVTEENSPPVFVQHYITPSFGEAGDTFTVVYDVVGFPTPVVVTDWFLDDNLIGSGSSIQVNSPGDLVARSTATNSEGQAVDSSEAVTVDPQGQAPFINTISITPNPGIVFQTAQPVVDVTGFPTPTMRYDWYLDDVLVHTGPTYTPQTYGQLKVTGTATNANGTHIRTSLEVQIKTGAPVASGPLPNVSYGLDSGDQNVDASIVFSVLGDPNLDTVTWDVAGPAGISIDGDGLVTIPTDSALSNALVTVDATNAEGSDSSGFLVSVTSSIAPPTYLGGLSNQTWQVGTPITAYATATYFSGVSLTFSANGLPDGLSMDLSGTITGTPTTDGNGTVTVTATNSEGSAAGAFSFVVEPLVTTPDNAILIEVGGDPILIEDGGDELLIDAA